MFKSFAFLAALLLLVCSGAEAAGGGIFVAGGQHFHDYNMDSCELQASTTTPWEALPLLQTERLDLASASYDGMLYAIGGSELTDRYQEIFFDSVEILDLSGGGWSYGPSLKTKRAFFAAVAQKGVVYAIGGIIINGGYSGTTPWDAITSVEMLDTSDLDGGWSEGPALQTVRGRHTAVGCNGKIYVIGGRTASDWAGGHLKSEIEILDTSDVDGGWSTGPLLKNARDELGAAALNGKIYVTGGKDGTNHNIAYDMEILDTNNLSAGWTLGPRNLRPRRRHVSAVLNGMICVMGGYDAGHQKGLTIATVEMFDPSDLAGGWSWGLPLVTLRAYHSGGEINGKGEGDVEHNTCAGIWSCDASCTASFTEVTSQSGNGAACPTQHTCTSGPSNSCSIIEAPKGVLAAPMQLDQWESYIYTPDEGVKGSSYSEPPAGGAIFYVLASTSTTVELECEVLTPSDLADSFFVWFDDEPFYVWNTGEHTSFEWTPVGSEDGSSTSTFALSAGMHTLHIGLREDGAQMRFLRISSGDAVFTVRSDGSLTPTDGPTDAPKSSSASAVLGAYPGQADAGVTGVVTVTTNIDILTITGSISGLPASTTGGFHIHSGFSCDTTEQVGDNWHNAATIAVDPWITTYSSDASGVAQLDIRLTKAELGYDVMDSFTHTVVAHGPDGKIACGVLGDGAIINFAFSGYSSTPLVPLSVMALALVASCA